MITTPNSINTMRKIEIEERLVINVIDECGLTKKKRNKKERDTYGCSKITALCR